MREKNIEFSWVEEKNLYLIIKSDDPILIFEIQNSIINLIKSTCHIILSTTLSTYLSNNLFDNYVCFIVTDNIRETKKDLENILEFIL